MSTYVPTAKELNQMGSRIKSKKLNRNGFMLKRDWLGRAVLMVSDVFVIDKLFDRYNVAYVSALRKANSDDMSDPNLAAICNELWELDNYMFRPSVFGGYVLCARRRYDMDAIIVPVKHRTLANTLESLTDAGHNVNGIIQHHTRNYIKLKAPAENE